MGRGRTSARGGVGTWAWGGMGGTLQRGAALRARAAERLEPIVSQIGLVGRRGRAGASAVVLHVHVPRHVEHSGYTPS